MISPSLYLARPFQIIPDHQSSPTGRYNGFQYCHDTALGRNNDSTEIHYTALGRYNGFIYCHYRGFGDLSDPGPGDERLDRRRHDRSVRAPTSVSLHLSNSREVSFVFLNSSGRETCDGDGDVGVGVAALPHRSGGRAAP